MSIGIGVKINKAFSKIATDSLLVPDNEIFVGIFYGQSESVGASSGSFSNATSLNSNAKCINGTPRPFVDLEPASLNDPIDGSLLTTLSEPLENLSLVVYQQTATREFLARLQDELTEDITFQCLGHGATAIGELMPDSEDFYTAITVIQAIERISGKKAHPVLFFYHGISDANIGTSTEDYESLTRELRRDFQLQIRKIRKDSFTLKMYMVQLNALSYEYATADQMIDIVQAQVNLSLKDKDIKLVQPTYPLTFSDVAHPNKAGQDLLGTFIANGYIEDKQGLIPITISDSGTQIVVTYDRDITTDGTITPVGGNNGFRSDAIITSVVLSGTTATINYIGTPTYISLAMNEDALYPNESNSDIVDNDGYHAIAFKLSTTWTRPVEDVAYSETYTHSLEAWETTYSEDCLFWFTGKLELADSSSIKCNAKTGTRFEAPTQGAVRYYDNGKTWIKAQGATYFETNTSSQAMGTHTIICVMQNESLTATIGYIISTIGGTNYAALTTESAKVGYFKNNASGTREDSILVADEKVVLSVSFNSFTNEYKIQKNKETPITFTVTGTAQQKAVFDGKNRIFGYGANIAAYFYNGKVASISMHTGELVGTTRLDTMVDDLTAEYITVDPEAPAHDPTDYRYAQCAVDLNKRLVDTYTGDHMIVRRSSDNLELSIPYLVNGDVNEAALLAHCGAGDGFIVTIFDNSCSGNDLTETDTTLQMKIVDSGVVVKTDGFVAALSSDVADENSNIGRSDFRPTDEYSMFLTFKTSRNNTSLIVSNTLAYAGWISNGGGSIFKNCGTPTIHVNNTSVTDNKLDVYNACLNTLSIVSFTDMDLSYSQWKELNTDYPNNTLVPADYFLGLIMLPFDGISERAAVTTEINSRYSAY